MRLIDADKIDFSEIFGGQSEFARDIREAAQEYINKQPTVSGTEERWISIKNKKKPREYETVLCVTDKNHWFVAVYNSEYGFRTGDIDVEGKVIAWQPLPEPYRPEKGTE